MADVPADRVPACYEILQAATRACDREYSRSTLVPGLHLDARIAGRVQGADRFTRGVAGCTGTQQGIRLVQQVVTHDAAAVPYDADRPAGTLQFAESSGFDGGQTDSIKLLYDPDWNIAFGRLSPGPIPPTARPGWLWPQMRPPAPERSPGTPRNWVIWTRPPASLRLLHAAQSRQGTWGSVRQSHAA